MGLMMNVPTKDYIVETIKEEILSGQIKPGTELAQEALAERLGVSRMPIREALQNLVQEGFAVRLPNRHMQAVVLDREQIHDVFHMIEMMMAENTILLAAKEHRQGGQLTEEDAEDPSSVQLERILKGMKNAPDERRMAEWEMLFHERLISLLGNAYLEQMQKKMLDGYAAYAITHMGDKKESCRRLKEVTEAMAANDDQKIREAFAVYFSSYANAFTSARDEEDKMDGEWSCDRGSGGALCKVQSEAWITSSQCHGCSDGRSLFYISRFRFCCSCELAGNGNSVTSFRYRISWKCEGQSAYC